jgi:hypothetical protein
VKIGIASPRLAALIALLAALAALIGFAAWRNDRAPEATSDSPAGAVSARPPAAKSPSTAKTAALASSPRVEAAATQASRTPGSAAPPTSAAVPPLERSRAIDLFAEKFAGEEAKRYPSEETQRRLAFEKQPLDAVATADANTSLATVLAGFDPQLTQHLAIASFECRGDECLLLAAENGIVYVPGDGNAWVWRAPIDGDELIARLAATPGWKTSGRQFDTFGAQYGRDGEALLWIYFTSPKPH